MRFSFDVPLSRFAIASRTRGVSRASLCLQM
jgi:hypothetical protein